MKIVAFHDVAKGSLAKLKEHYPAHRARLEDFRARGLLIAAGPLGNPPESAMGVLASREAAEEFIKGDPFVTNGVVSKWRPLEWNAAFM
jgi:uncharacterized protein YciI